jgi:hypothetical protein
VATLDEVVEVVQEFEGAYMGQCAKWDTAQWTKVYHQFHDVLADVPYPLLKLASRYWRSTEKWFPQPSLLFDALLRLKSMAEGVPDKFEAWEEARKLAVKRAWWNEGGTGLVARDVMESDCSHPMVFAAITKYGLRELRQSDNGAPDRKHFWDTYEGLCKRQHEDDVVRLLLPEVREAMGRLGEVQKRIAAVAEDARF